MLKFVLNTIFNMYNYCSWIVGYIYMCVFVDINDFCHCRFETFMLISFGNKIAHVRASNNGHLNSVQSAVTIQMLGN